MLSIPNYQVVRELARGAMGVVFEAHDPLLERQVAVKLLLPSGSSQVQDAAMFKREMRAAARLRHPHIVGLHAAGLTPDGRPYLVMDLLTGGSLSDLLKARGTLPETQAARIALGLAEGLAYAHGQGVLHRDIKPANVLLDDRGEPSLADFGLGQLLDDNDRLTTTGDFVGTLNYASPEQVKGERSRFGPATDVYGLGALLYALLVGRAPFPEHDVTRLANRVVGEPAEFPPTAAARIDADLREICLRCLAKAPEDRFPSAGALASALERWLIAASGRRPAPSPGARRRRAPGRGAWWSAAAGVVVGALAAVAVDTYQEWPAPEEVTRLWRRGGERNSRGDVTGALEDWRRALEAEPDDWFVWNRVGMAHFNEERYEEALAAYDQALELEPDDDHDRATLLSNRAYALKELGRSDEALELFDRAIALDGSAPSFLIGRGELRREGGDLDAAVADYRRVLELDPRQAAIIVKLAMVRLERGASQESLLPDFDRALAILPDDPGLLRNRATLYRNHGDPQRAVEDYGRALAALGEGQELLMARGRTYFDNDQYFLACADFTVAESLAPEDPQPLVWKGMALYLMGNPELALEESHRALTLAEPGSQDQEDAEALLKRIVSGR